MRWVILASRFVAGAAHAQDYDVPMDYRNVAWGPASDLATCLASSASYNSDMACASTVNASCVSRGPDGDTTAGLSICGGTSANVLDQEINVVWRRLKRDLPAPAFAELLAQQRDWLTYRAREAQAAAGRYGSGSMGAYSGWIVYDEMSAERLSRLREIHRGALR